MLDDIFRDMEEGLQIGDILEDVVTLGDQQTADCATDMLVAIRSGRSFASGAEGWFSPTLCATLAAAENGNDFAKTGREVVAIMVGGASSILNDVMLKVGVPALYFLILMGMCAYMSEEVFPVIEAVVPQEQWKDSTWIVYFTGSIIGSYWYLIAGVLGAAFIAVSWALTSIGGPFRSQIDQLPMLKAYRTAQGSRILLALGILMTAGESVRRALGLIEAREPAHTSYYLRRMVSRVDAGRTVSQAVDVGLFSVKEVVALRRRERQRSFGEAIVEVAKRAAENRIIAIKQILVVPQLLFFGLDAFYLFMVFDGLRFNINI